MGGGETEDPSPPGKNKKAHGKKISATPLFHSNEDFLKIKIEILLTHHPPPNWSWFHRKLTKFLVIILLFPPLDITISHPCWDLKQTADKSVEGRNARAEICILQEIWKWYDFIILFKNNFKSNLGVRRDVSSWDRSQRRPVRYQI